VAEAVSALHYENVPWNVNNYKLASMKDLKPFQFQDESLKSWGAGGTFTDNVIHDHVVRKVEHLVVLDLDKGTKLLPVGRFTGQL
jgi:hypothetical protein